MPLLLGPSLKGPQLASSTGALPRAHSLLLLLGPWGPRVRLGGGTVGIIIGVWGVRWAPPKRAPSLPLLLGPSLKGPQLASSTGALPKGPTACLLVHTSDRCLKRARAHNKAPQLAVECWGLSDSQLVAGASRVHMWIYIMGCGRQHGDVQWIGPIYWFCPIYPAR